MSTVPPPAGPSSTCARLGDHDLYLFNEGSHYRLYEKFGSHPCIRDGVAGTDFTVWAPAAERVTVVGDFNSWDNTATPLKPQGSSGIWTGTGTSS